MEESPLPAFFLPSPRSSRVRRLLVFRVSHLAGTMLTLGDRGDWAFVLDSGLPSLHPPPQPSDMVMLASQGRWPNLYALTSSQEEQC